MRKIGFDSDKFIELEKNEILKRINANNSKLYLELGGKIFDDLHASRVLPGYRPDNKIKILETLKDDLEVIFCISARDIEKNKMRSDLGITYDVEVMRLIDKLKGRGLSVNCVCITLFENQPSAIKFGDILKRRGEKVYFHSVIDNYPNDVDLIVSDRGYGKNPYIETTKPLVVVSAPGPGSCKMATALSQMYHEYKKGIKSGYAKFETFPVWNLPIDHPVNIAYESATADLNDKNMVDHYHEKAYGIKAINYNRDLETYPVLNQILTKIQGQCVYKSPTDMGINMVADCITDDECCREAGKQEIIRRYLKARVEYKKGQCSQNTVLRTYEIMKSQNLDKEDRPVCDVARKTRLEKNSHIVAIELPDGSIITGKTQGLITATAGAVLNALKHMAYIPHENIVDREAVKNISALKETLGLGSTLDLKDIFIAMSILQNSDESTQKALAEIHNLKGCEVHSTYILSSADEDFLRKLKMNLTCDDVFATTNLIN